MSEQMEMGRVVRACRLPARRWYMYGRTYRVARVKSLYWARGAARGLRAHYLDKLGPRSTRAEMQAALDAMARRRGAMEVKG